MARRPILIALESLAAAALAVAPTIAVHRLLEASGPLAAVTGWAIVTSVLLVLSSRLRGTTARVVRRSAVGIAIAGALILVADMVMIPLSAYLIWFDLVQTGNARGAVSFVFVMLVAYGSVLWGSSLARRPLLATSAFVAWIAFLAVPLLGRVEPLIVLAGASLVVFLTIAVRGYAFGPALRAATHTVSIALLALLAALGLAAVTSPQGSRLVDNVLNPGLRRSIVTLFPAFPIMYDVPGYGYRFSSENIGRRPALSNRALFRVSPVEHSSIYLRTEVFHRFSGSGWRVAEADAADETDETEAPDESSVSRRTEVTILADFYSMIPHTLDTQAIAVSDRDQVDFERSGKDYGYHLDEPLLYGDRVTLSRGELGNAAEAGDLTDEVYLQVPEELSASVRELALGLKGESDSHTIVNTLRFLRDGFEYTLEAPQPSDRSAFLEAFIEEHRRGFCVHFATAFTVMSRIQGIPARYVTGFLVQPPDFEDPTMPIPEDVTVSGYSAHAWSEVRLPDGEWRIVEATPPMQPVGYEDTFFDRFTGIRNEGRTRQQLEEILRRELEDADARTRRAFRFPDLPLWLLFVFVPLVASGAGYVVHRSRQPDRRFRSAVRRLSRRSARAGLPPPERVGWTGWADAARAASPGADHAARVATIILAVSFGGREPTRRDARFLRRWSRSV